MKMHSFKITQVVRASRRQVYSTWTNLKLAKQFAAPPGCTVKLFKSNFKVGGKYQTSMKTPHGVAKNSGEYLAIEPGKRIIQTFVWDAPDTELNVIVIDFAERGSSTVMTLSGLGFSSKDEAQGNQGGWKGSLKQFADYFS